MDKIELQSHQEPGIAEIDRFEELKKQLFTALERYRRTEYNEKTLAAARNDRKELTRLHKQLEEHRKEIRRGYLEPLEDFEAGIKELTAMVDEPLNRIKDFLTASDRQEKDKKRAAIEAYFARSSAVLGDLAQKVWESPAFLEEKWLNKSTSARTWQTAVDEKIALTALDLQSIHASGGPYAGALISRYLEKFSMDGIPAYRDQLTELVRKAASAETPAEGYSDRRTGYKIVKLTGIPDRMIQATELLTLAGIEWEELEDGMPQPMEELLSPSFDSFVAFDIETTGTYGAANGDDPAEITEIGAVRVQNGRVTDRFSSLVNPGRSILPRISEITKITDAMVADAPPVDEIIRKFAAFIGRDILVGHNIKASDLYYIGRAARRAGVRIENRFFDTYIFAKKLRERAGWENLKLEYLAASFGIAHPNAHRAFCDAEVNAAVYFELRKLQ